MAKTPYNSLKSEDILAGHISGLQTDINKIQEVLDMKTGTRSGHALEPVIDQDDPSLRYRIYEATERNWLESPAPTIYRNGSEVPSDEYILHAPYGVVVFHEQQNSNDSVTADFTHIMGTSTKIENLDSSVSNLQGDLSTAQGDINELDNRVTDLEDNPPSNGGGGSINVVGSLPLYNLPGSYITHMRMDYNPFTNEYQDGDWVESPNVTGIEPSFNVMVYGGTMDAFPLPIEREITVAQAAIMLGEGTPYAVRVKIGLYKDNGNMYPGELVFSAHDIIVNPGEWGYYDVNQTIPPGLYWIVRMDKSTSWWNGIGRANAIHLEVFDAVSFLRNLAERPDPFTTRGGYRATDVPWTDEASLPQTFPSGVELFSRADYCSPWLVLG